MHPHGTFFPYPSMIGLFWATFNQWAVNKDPRTPPNIHPLIHTHKWLAYWKFFIKITTFIYTSYFIYAVTKKSLHASKTIRLSSIRSIHHCKFECAFYANLPSVRIFLKESLSVFVSCVVKRAASDLTRNVFSHPQYLRTNSSWPW